MSEIRIVRDYPHPPAKVWRALTDPDLISLWTATGAGGRPEGFTPTAGTTFRFIAKPKPGWNGIVNCEVLEVNEPSLLRYSWTDDGGGDVTEVVYPGAPAHQEVRRFHRRRRLRSHRHRRHGGLAARPERRRQDHDRADARHAHPADLRYRDGLRLPRKDPARCRAFGDQPDRAVRRPGAAGFTQLHAALAIRFTVAVTPERRTLSVPAPQGAEDLAAVTAAVRGAGISVDEIALRHPTLDDAFLALTGPPPKETTYVRPHRGHATGAAHHRRVQPAVSHSGGHPPGHPGYGGRRQLAAAAPRPGDDRLLHRHHRRLPAPGRTEILQASLTSFLVRTGRGASHRQLPGVWKLPAIR